MDKKEKGLGSSDRWGHPLCPTIPETERFAESDGLLPCCTAESEVAEVLPRRRDHNPVKIRIILTVRSGGMATRNKRRMSRECLRSMAWQKSHADADFD